MPATKVVNQATSANAMTGLQFSNIPPGFISLWASGVTAGDTIGLTVGGQPIIDQVSGQPNIEISADVVDYDRDLIIFREVHRGGEVFLPVTATTAVNFILISE